VNRPAARYSIYQRNIDWLRFWLQDVVDPAPEKKEQYQRWAVMKEQRDWNEKQLRDGKDATAEFVRQLRAGTSRTEQPSDGLAPMIREKTVHRPR
jgi:hypothetical protein